MGLRKTWTLSNEILPKHIKIHVLSRKEYTSSTKPECFHLENFESCWESCEIVFHLNVNASQPFHLEFVCHDLHANSIFILLSTAAKFIVTALHSPFCCCLLLKASYFHWIIYWKHLRVGKIQQQKSCAEERYQNKLSSYCSWKKKLSYVSHIVGALLCSTSSPKNKNMEREKGRLFF